MLGAGMFFVWAPAAAYAGAGILIALPIAAAVAALNALSTTRLAIEHPVSGGAFAYGQAELSPAAGFVAGVLFLVGKTASVAAIASVAGAYLLPAAPIPVAVGSVLVLAALNASGIRSTAVVSVVITSFVVAALVVVLAISVAGHHVAPPSDIVSGGPAGVLQAAALIFFTFAGYARVATLGEEVRDPARTLPIAVISALVLVLLLAAAVAVVLLEVLGPARLAASSSPLAAAAGRGTEPVIRIVAAVASLGSLLSVLAGLSRTSFAMARARELPARLARVSSRTATPVVAEAAVAAVGIAAVLLLRPAALVGVSACAVLGYYAVAHLAAIGMSRRRGERMPLLAALGLLGCLLLALATPWQAILGVAVAVLAALGIRTLARRRLAP